MRIIAGEAKGKKLAPPSDDSIRPALDRIRESVFATLEGSFENGKVLDLFAGVGSLGLEAISRGARRAVFVDQAKRSLSILKKNIEFLGFTSRCEVIAANALEQPDILALEPESYALIFMDPPYGGGRAGPCMKSLLEKNWVGETSLLVLEVDKNDEVEVPKDLEIVKTLKQGFRRVHFIEKSA